MLKNEAEDLYAYVSRDESLVLWIGLGESQGVCQAVLKFKLPPRLRLVFNLRTTTFASIVRLSVDAYC